MTNGEKMLNTFHGEVTRCDETVFFTTGGWHHAYDAEWWNAEYKEPTTKNNLGVDDEERELALMYLEQIKEDYIEGNGYERHPLPEYYAIETAIKSLAMPSVTPQLSVPEVTALAEWTEKLTKECEDAYNKGYTDGVKSVNICPHCGEYIGEESEE